MKHLPSQPAPPQPNPARPTPVPLTPEAFAEDLVFPEGPRWHAGKLWLSDMHGGGVYRFDESGSREEIVRVSGRPSGLGFTSEGRLLVVSMADRRLLRADPSGLTEVADLSALAPGDLNDMVVDASGRAYIGNFGYDPEKGEEPRPTGIILVSPDGAARTVADDLHFPNGSVILPGGRSFVVAESMAGRLTAFDIAPDGGLGGRRVFASLEGRMPDGIAADAEGAIWVSCFMAGEFLRVREGGEVTDRVSLQPSGRRAVACALGGEDRRTLYLLTAETTPEELARGVSRGFVERLRVEVPGAGIP